jgi:hypothetical protein
MARLPIARIDRMIADGNQASADACCGPAMIGSSTSGSRCVPRSRSWSRLRGQRHPRQARPLPSGLLRSFVLDPDGHNIEVVNHNRHSTVPCRPLASRRRWWKARTQLKLLWPRGSSSRVRKALGGTSVRANNWYRRLRCIRVTAQDGPMPGRVSAILQLLRLSGSTRCLRCGRVALR